MNDPDGATFAAVKYKRPAGNIRPKPNKWTFQIQQTMKKIEAIVRLSRFDRIRDALALIDVNFFTLSEVKGFGLQKGEKLMYRGSVYDEDFIARLKIDIFCTDEKVQPIIDAILSAGKTGDIGDGKIVVIGVENIIRIRNGDAGPEAL